MVNEDELLAKGMEGEKAEEDRKTESPRLRVQPCDHSDAETVSLGPHTAPDVDKVQVTIPTNELSNIVKAMYQPDAQKAAHLTTVYAVHLKPQGGSADCTWVVVGECCGGKFLLINSDDVDKERIKAVYYEYMRKLKDEESTAQICDAEAHGKKRAAPPSSRSSRRRSFARSDRAAAEDSDASYLPESGTMSSEDSGDGAFRRQQKRQKKQEQAAAMATQLPLALFWAMSLEANRMLVPPACNVRGRDKRLRMQWTEQVRLQLPMDVVSRALQRLRIEFVDLLSYGGKIEAPADLAVVFPYATAYAGGGFSKLDAAAYAKRDDYPQRVFVDIGLNYTCPPSEGPGIQGLEAFNAKEVANLTQFPLLGEYCGGNVSPLTWADKSQLGAERPEDGGEGYGIQHTGALFAVKWYLPAIAYLVQHDAHGKHLVDAQVPNELFSGPAEMSQHVNGPQWRRLGDMHARYVKHGEALFTIMQGTPDLYSEPNTTIRIEVTLQTVSEDLAAVLVAEDTCGLLEWLVAVHNAFSQMWGWRLTRPVTKQRHAQIVEVARAHSRAWLNHLHDKKQKQRYLSDVAVLYTLLGAFFLSLGIVNKNFLFRYGSKVGTRLVSLTPLPTLFHEPIYQLMYRAGGGIGTTCYDVHLAAYIALFCLRSRLLPDVATAAVPPLDQELDVDTDGASSSTCVQVLLRNHSRHLAAALQNALSPKREHYRATFAETAYGEILGAYTTPCEVCSTLMEDGRSGLCRECSNNNNNNSNDKNNRSSSSSSSSSSSHEINNDEENDCENGADVEDKENDNDDNVRDNSTRKKGKTKKRKREDAEAPINTPLQSGRQCLLYETPTFAAFVSNQYGTQRSLRFPKALWRAWLTGFEENRAAAIPSGVIPWRAVYVGDSKRARKFQELMETHAQTPITIKNFVTSMMKKWSAAQTETA